MTTYNDIQRDNVLHDVAVVYGVALDNDRQRSIEEVQALLSVASHLYAATGDGRFEADRQVLAGERDAHFALCTDPGCACGYGPANGGEEPIEASRPGRPRLRLIPGGLK